MSTTVEVNTPSISSSNNNNKHRSQKGNNSSNASNAPLNPKLKLTIRQLPPSLPEEVFKSSIKPYLTDEKDIVDQKFIPGKVSKKVLTPSKPSRAVIKFETIQKLINFKNLFKNHVYVDQQGVEFKIQIIFSPIQQNPKENNIQDAKLNTLESDPEFIKFCSKLHSEGEKEKSNNSNEILLGAQQQSTNEANKKSTPLLEYLKAKKMEKASKNKFKSSAALKGEDGQKSKSGKKSKKEKAAKQAQTTDEASSATKLSKAAKLKKKKAKASEEKGADGKSPKEFTIAKKSSDSTGSPQVEKIVLAKRQDSSTSVQKESSTNSPTSSLSGAKLAQRSDKSSYKSSEAKTSILESKSALQAGEGSGTSAGSPIEKPSSRRTRKGKTFSTEQAAGLKPAGEASTFPKKGKKSINKSGANLENQQTTEANIASSPRQTNNGQESSKKSDLGTTGLVNNSGSEANSDRPGTETKFKSKAKPKISKPKGPSFGSKFGDAENSTGFKSPTESNESGAVSTKPAFKKLSYKPTDETSGEPRAPKPPRNREANPKFGGKPGQSEEGGDAKSKPKKYRPKPNKPAAGTGPASGTQPNA
ncbi:hypothetical protein CONCODRAFT_79154 [Conidiobolus coronatus NRRL 28638]|uniref:UPF3 domain-containing protein n=1 Tax=Conidiobolus coronatus (strain ATCC 28846 / CBS 209.66 / NRRL 28638) TaxID=796925 RepID=A0A137P3Z8_CONC2|nr:hypothetical protein CONCODRAFT_79154 [Conidiobolus coronatus NRRL 28638]|eukprot:KXN69750.1 hypothetical protein CONCODRAFT_79154 [Conidiobolus coronatus NRRL 28638]